MSNNNINIIVGSKPYIGIPEGHFPVKHGTWVQWGCTWVNYKPPPSPSQDKKERLVQFHMIESKHSNFQGAQVVIRVAKLIEI